MAETWPLTLPQSPLSGSLSIQKQENLVRAPADIGVGPRRRRASAVSHTMAFAMLLTSEELAVLKQFYDVTLGGGALSFDFTDPTTGDTREYYFDAPYQVQHEQVDIFRVSLVLISKAA
jgi:hypothetical protein